MSSRVTTLVDALIVRYAKYIPKRLFWEFRAKNIDQLWGTQQDDYPVLKNILQETEAKSILDIGCGTGRLFPLFLQEKIPIVVGQDVSRWALRKAKQRYPSPTIKVIHTPLDKIGMPCVFDLIISNRVLSAVKPDELEKVLKNLFSISKYLYLNEYSSSDGGQPSSYWFMHDYHVVLSRICAFNIVEQGKIGKQSYELLKIGSLDT